MTRRAFRSIVASLAVLGLLVTACTAGGGEEGTSPSPSVREADVVAATLAKLKDPELTARFTFTGTFRIGGGTTEVSGDGAFHGPDYETTVQAEGSPVTFEDVVVDETHFTKMGDGPWVREPEPTTDPFQRMDDLDYVGSETREGEALHHLRTPTGFRLVPSDIGETDSSVSRLRGVHDFYVRDDGTFVVIVLEVQGMFDPGGEGSSSTEYVYSVFGEEVAIDEPADVWETFVSEKDAYSIAHPAGWKRSRRDGNDWFQSASGEVAFVQVDRVAAGTTLDQVVAREIASSGQPEGRDRGSLGNEPAQVLTYHFEQGGDELFLLISVAVLARQAYALVWVSLAGDESVDRATFEDLASTFEFIA
jgi:hypothetical protein